MKAKEKTRGRPKKDKTQLDANSILECAKKLLFEEGKIPSIRKVASVLSIDPMSIYYYFPNKNSLLEAITVSLIEDIYEPRSTNPWKKDLELLSKSYLSLLNNYPGLLEIMLGMSSEGPANVFIGRLQTILSSLGLDEKSFDSALCLLADYLHGVAISMQYNRNNNQLTISQIDEPLNLYICAIENL